MPPKSDPTISGDSKLVIDRISFEGDYDSEISLCDLLYLVHNLSDEFKPKAKKVFMDLINNDHDYRISYDQILDKTNIVSQIFD